MLRFPPALLAGMAAFLALLSFTPSAGAQATGTWVSGVGDDANPCSRTAPCKTFAGAISKTAAGGIIRVLDPGGFGVVTITKSITIDGTGTLADVIGAGTNGVIVNAGVNDSVVLRNISLNGIGTGLTGVRFLAGKSLTVEDVAINGFTQKGIDFSPAATSTLFLTRSIIRNTSGPLSAGLSVASTTGFASAVVQSSLIEGNGAGISSGNHSRVTVARSTIAGNTGYGVVAVATAGSATVTLDQTTVSMNGIGVRAEAAGTIRLSDVDLLENGVGIETATGGIVVTWGNVQSGGNAVPGAPNAPVIPFI